MGDGKGRVCWGGGRGKEGEDVKKGGGKERERGREENEEGGWRCAGGKVEGREEGGQISQPGEN